MSDGPKYSDQDASIYSTLSIVGTTYEIGFRSVAKMLGDLTGQSFLDFGSGTGRSAYFLRSLGARRIYGVDHNVSMVRAAQNMRIPGAIFILMSRLIPLRDACMDGAIALNVFVEMPSLEVIRQTCAEIARVLKPNGTFVLMSASVQVFGHRFRNFNYDSCHLPARLESGAEVVCTIVSGTQSFSVTDRFWTEEDYLRSIESADMSPCEILYPTPDVPEQWSTDERMVAPFVVIRAHRHKKAAL